MALNEIFAPNGPHNKMSLPVTQKEGHRVESGSPVMVGAIVGVAQTALEDVDGGTTGVVNSNAPGHVTVWNGGTWRLKVNTTGQAGTIGGIVYAKAEAGTSLVSLATKSAAGLVPFGVLYEAEAAGNANAQLAVRVFEYAGPAEA